MDNKVGLESLNDEVFQSQLKSKYKGKIFIGLYKEKRLCSLVKEYRDRIDISKTEGRELDLNELISELKDHLSSNVFVGIAKADDNFTFWTELEDPLPFGKFWFQVSHELNLIKVQLLFYFYSQIKTIKFRSNEIQIRLKKLRSIEDADTRTFAEKLRTSTQRSSTKTDGDAIDKSVDDAIDQWRTLYDFWKREASAAAAWFLSISFNRQTITETLRFISLVIVSLFAGSTQIVKYMGIFAIKLIERTTWLVHVLTPIALGMLDLFSKVIGGLYYLIAMIWKDSIAVRRQPQQNRIEAGPRRSQPEAIRYNNYD